MLNTSDPSICAQVALSCHNALGVFTRLSKREVGKANVIFAGTLMRDVLHGAIGESLMKMYIEILNFNMMDFEWDSERAAQRTIDDYIRLHPIRPFVMMGWRIAKSLVVKPVAGIPRSVEVYSKERLIGRSELCQCGRIDHQYFEEPEGDIFEQELKKKEKP